jgi:hypothetical protein
VRVEHERVRSDNKKWRFVFSSSNFSRMSPPRVGASSKVGQNIRSSAWVKQIGTQEMPTVMNVDEIQTPEYEPTTTHVEEEQSTTPEDAERTESNASRGKGPQQEEHAMG